MPMSLNTFLTKVRQYARRQRRALDRSKPRTARLAVNPLERRELLTGVWTAFTNTAPGGVGTMMLLSDGSVMAQKAGTTNTWYKLTPGANGQYASSGTWSTLASMSTQRLYYASNMLLDGRVFLVGGEYSGSSGSQNDNNTGE